MSENRAVQLKKTWYFILAAAIIVWWVGAAPRSEIQIAPSVVIDQATEEAIAAVDRSSEFRDGLEYFPSELPQFDDVVYLAGGTKALVSATDGKIWTVDLKTHAAEPFVDVPLMAFGIHEAPDNPNYLYFCASHSYGGIPPGEAVGLYRLTLDTRAIEPLVTKVPDTSIDRDHPVVYSDTDPKAPELHRDGAGVKGRNLIVCDNLEVSEDGRRIYFSEPFSYQNASLDDAIDEAIALNRGGRLWRYDLDSGRTRLIAEAFHFINGVLYDLHPGTPREVSLLVTQTSLFRLTRFYLNGPKAGTAEVVLDGLTGMDDGMDRDASGRIWLALFRQRSGLLTWLHANAWAKPFFMRLPLDRLMLPQRTGVTVVSPDGRTPLYAATYEGERLSAIPSAVPGRDAIYLANESLQESDRNQTGIVRLKWPKELR